MKQLHKSIFSSFLLFLITSASLSGQVRFPRLIGDGMILQRDTQVRIWGWASPGEQVTISFNEQSYRTSAGNDGSWLINMPSQNAGGPYEMEISASNHIILKNVMFGDVWLCSGQSNMEYYFSRLTDRYAGEIAASKNSYIRQFKVPMYYKFDGPAEDYPTGDWQEANPESLLNFSAVAYFFAKAWHNKYGVPVGIINASVGGSPAEAWMSLEALAEFPDYLAEAEKFKDASYVNMLRQKESEAINSWYHELDGCDKGLHAIPSWKDPGFDASDWSTMPVPGFWADQGLGWMNGVVWFRKTVDLPSSFSGSKSWIQLGRMIDADSVFINGKFVGRTSYQYPQRKYEIPPGILKPGENIIVIRLINNAGKGGFIPDKPYRLMNQFDSIDLTGLWQYQPGCSMRPTPGQTFIQWKPTALYNGMIAPANNYTISGVAWYQGESNAERYGEYQKLLTALIKDWREKHDQGDFPFVIAQLPNYMKPREDPSESSWASFRNAQLKTVKSVYNTAISVNIDLGEWNDIHPQNKMEVGRRLALAAEGLDKGDKRQISNGPVCESFKIKGNKVILFFIATGSGLVVSDGGKLKQFAIAGEDHNYKWAEAKIKGNKVIVWRKDITNPIAVRYAWADNPEGANLYNKEGIPASPFTTEDL